LGHGGIARRARLIEENSPRLCHSQGFESRSGPVLGVGSTNQNTAALRCG